MPAKKKSPRTKAVAKRTKAATKSDKPAGFTIKIGPKLANQLAAKAGKGGMRAAKSYAIQQLENAAD